MPLTIPDERLQSAGMNEREARIEIACRLYDAGRLVMREATRWAGLTRTEFETELISRGLPLFWPTIEQLHADIAAMDRLGI